MRRHHDQIRIQRPRAFHDFGSHLAMLREMLDAQTMIGKDAAEAFPMTPRRVAEEGVIGGRLQDVQQDQVGIKAGRQCVGVRGGFRRPFAIQRNTVQ